MDEVIFRAHIFGKLWVVTPWKLIGYCGVAMFSGRWLVQVIASHVAGRSHLPRLFWYMSLAGSLLLLSYFMFSNKADSVGILSQLFPPAIAAYNLVLIHRRGRAPEETARSRAAESASPR